MRVPPMSSCGLFGVHRNTNSLKQTKPQMIKPIQNDTVSFSSYEKSKYYRLYTTLPDEVKESIGPGDFIDMLQSMEFIANGRLKGIKIASSEDADVYENPWLNSYYIMIVQNTEDNTSLTYTKTNIGDLVWTDSDDSRIQLLKRAG